METKHTQPTARFRLDDSVYNLADLKVANYNDAFSACKVTRDDINEVPYDKWRAMVTSETTKYALYIYFQNIYFNIV